MASDNAYQKALFATDSGNVSLDGPDMENLHHRGGHFVIDIDKIEGTAPTALFTVQGKDANGNYYTLLASTALNATGVTVLKIYPGLVVAANAAANDIVPRHYRVIMTKGGTVTFLTFKVSVALVK